MGITCSKNESRAFFCFFFFFFFFFLILGIDLHGD